MAKSQKVIVSLEVATPDEARELLGLKGAAETAI